MIIRESQSDYQMCFILVDIFIHDAWHALQVCKKNFGTAKLTANIEKTATLLAHELGHGLGSFHDGGKGNGTTYMFSIWIIPV